MFNDKFCLTQAVLDGTKTMTRRIEKFEPSARLYDKVYNIEGGMNDKGQWIFTLFNKYGEIIGDIIPRYNVGEVVAIAQSYKAIYDEMETNFGNAKANAWWSDAYDVLRIPARENMGYNNKMFTRADLMIHHIKITNVRLERLRSIPDDDIMREGIYVSKPAPYNRKMDGYSYDASKDRTKKKWWYSTPREAYAALIDKISGKGTWLRNPWVVVYEFEKVD